MGQIIQLSPQELIPTQRIYVPQILDYVLSCHLNGKESIIDPITVRVNPITYLGEGYLVIDGHHRAGIAYALGIKSIDVYVANHERDFMDKPMMATDDSLILEQASTVLYRGFNQAIRYREKFLKGGMREFEDIVVQFSDKNEISLDEYLWCFNPSGHKNAKHPYDE